MHTFSGIRSGVIIQVAFTVFKEVLSLFRGSSDRMGVAIQDVVLEHEYKIEDDWHYAEHPLHNVEAAATEGGLTMSHRLDHVLQDWEETACEIQHDVSNGPALRAFSSIVKEHLRHVFDKGNEGLAVASSTQKLNVLIKLYSGYLNEKDNKDKKPFACNQHNWPHN